MQIWVYQVINQSDYKNDWMYQQINLFEMTKPLLFEKTLYVVSDSYCWSNNFSIWFILSIFLAIRFSWLLHLYFDCSIFFYLLIFYFFRLINSMMLVCMVCFFGLQKMSDKLSNLPKWNRLVKKINQTLKPANFGHFVRSCLMLRSFLIRADSQGPETQNCTSQSLNPQREHLKVLK